MTDRGAGLGGTSVCLRLITVARSDGQIGLALIISRKHCQPCKQLRPLVSGEARLRMQEQVPRGRHAVLRVDLLEFVYMLWLSPGPIGEVDMVAALRCV